MRSPSLRNNFGVRKPFFDETSLIREELELDEAEDERLVERIRPLSPLVDLDRPLLPVVLVEVVLVVGFGCGDEEDDEDVEVDDVDEMDDARGRDEEDRDVENGGGVGEMAAEGFRLNSVIRRTRSIKIASGWWLDVDRGQYSKKGHPSSCERFSNSSCVTSSLPPTPSPRSAARYATMVVGPTFSLPRTLSSNLQDLCIAYLVSAREKLTGTAQPIRPVNRERMTVRSRCKSE